MSVRCLWILSLSKDNFGKFLLYRTFPTVEKKCKSFHGDDYIPLPTLSLFGSSLLIKLGLSVDSNQFVEWRDKSSRTTQLPVVEVTVENQDIWPVVVVQSSYLVCCLPYVEMKKTVNKEDLLQIPSISVGFSVLLGVINFLGQSSNTEQETSRLIELDNYLTLSMPFGTPSDVEGSCLSYIQSFPSQKFQKRQPAWKPLDYKGKQQIHFKIMEFARCVQSDHAGGLCHFEVFGQVSVKAELEGILNEVIMTVSGADSSRLLLLNSIIVHPCVEIRWEPSSPVAGLLKRLRFSPPLHEFTLFHYCSPLPEPPIQGVFKLLGESTVELLLQLKLSEKVKNSFEFCDVVIAFFNRGPVKNIEFNVNHGVPKLSEDKYSLKWTIGTKFPKDLETVLTSKIEFQDEPKMPNSDPFCVDKNCYAQINFKQNNTNLSGCYIDPKFVTVSQGNKAKMSIDRYVQSAEYRIWNNYGDVPFPVNITNKYRKLSV